MNCGKCKNCVPNDVCNGDCLCRAKDLEVSQDDSIEFYGTKENSPCELFEMAV